MSTTIPRDFDAIRADLLARIPILTDRWTDTNPSDLGTVLVELLAFTADTLHYYLDAQLAEAFLSSARSRDSVFRLARMLGYEPTMAAPSQAMLRFRVAAGAVNGAYGEDIEIPAGCVCRAGSVSFVTLDDAVIPAGSTYVDVAAQQGVAGSVTYQGTGARMRFPLTSVSLADSSVRVSVGGEAWQAVQHFLDSAQDDHHYRVELGADNVHTVVFGRDGKGLTPASGQAVLIGYLDTLGASGNVGAGRITTLIGPIYGTQPTRRVMDSNILQVTNPVQSSGGASPDTTDRVRALAPITFAAQGRCVTPQDYVAAVSALPGVARAAVLDCNDCENLPYRHVALLVEPSGGGYATPTQKAATVALIESMRPAGIEVRVYDPSYVSVAIIADIYVARGTSALTGARQAAETAVAALVTGLAFGQSLTRSAITAALTVDGVAAVTLASPAADRTFGPTQIPVLSGLTLRFHSTEAQ
jgi:hypothetical protein